MHDRDQFVVLCLEVNVCAWRRAIPAGQARSQPIGVVDQVLMYMAKIQDHFQTFIQRVFLKEGQAPISKET